MQILPHAPLPSWVPEEVGRYLEHTESGRSIRQLARKAGCHASTVLRQVRRVEARRDDPLIDGALAQLAARCFARSGALPALAEAQSADMDWSGEGFERKAEEVLALLSRSGAVLAVAGEMEKAVVVRDGADRGAAQKSAVGKALAGALALLDWIACTRPGRISRYQITPAGRSALNRIVASRENRARAALENGFAEGQAPLMGQSALPGRLRKSRYGLGETPLDMLARLTDREGDPFLTPRLVSAGRRLREDYELAQIGSHISRGEQHFTPGNCALRSSDQPVCQTAEAARLRMTEALNMLGPGLSDIALRCCCYLEGLETAERQLGWSARSGKIVLRIALQQLASHYDALPEREAAMIG
ncbi:DUF6456 domain-containing protein [Cribrihabitans neustonicus]|uniref:DUF6456 domain-containing protein n=1 Tax=Cribrihabitans neustonicus TaxID=1429085 RepID=UPI003B5BFA18